MGGPRRTFAEGGGVAGAMMQKRSDPSAVRQVLEVRRPARPDRWVHPEWEVRFPWLVQGTTGSTWEASSVASRSARVASDFALIRDGERRAAGDLWVALARALGFPSVVGSRQVHGRVIRLHEEAPPLDSWDDPEGGGAGSGGLFVASDADGHATGKPGILMAVTVADCVPVFVLDPRQRAVALLHAGWKGVVAGVLDAGIELMKRRFGSAAEDLFVHLGPAICGDCYEVGAEVHQALGLPLPDGPRAVDLRGILTRNALARDLRSQQVTASAHCTRCHPSPFFSHRGGDVERQVGYLGIRPRI